MILIYLIKSSLCLTILIGFYKLALENKAMHQFKRFYLLASILFSFTIPLVTFTYETATIAEVAPAYIEYVVPTLSSVKIASPVTVDYTSIILWSIYILGVIIFATRFINNLLRLKRKIKHAEILSSQKFTLALLEDTIIPHSFLQWIFVNKNAYTQKEIASEVIAHEITHVQQKHSLDILFIEFLQVLFWFNPCIWIYKKAIKLNHEFLADQGAIADNSNIAIYQNILLSYASSTHHTALESPFNYSLTKKRIIMLSQSFSRKKVVLRALLLVPVVAICSLLFNQEIIAQQNPDSHDVSTDSYASQFIEGAARNGKKALVIEVRNDSIYINGQYKTLDTFRESVNEITENWDKKEYADPVSSMILKGNTEEFIKKAEKEFKKTILYMANNSLRLIPPAPPALHAKLPIPPAPLSLVEHLIKMRKLGGLFIYEGKEVSFDKAVALVSRDIYNVKTPYPYTNPPKTFISRASQDTKASDISKQDTIKATKEEINTYNTLVKRYNENPTAVLTAKVRGQLFKTYGKMTPIQREKAIPFPKLPPPPSAPKQEQNPVLPINQKNNHFEVKGSYDENGSLSKNVKQHALNGGTFEFEGKEITKEQALQKIKESNISTQTSSFHNKMIIIKNILTSNANYYLNNKLLSEDEINQLDISYKSVLISRGSEKEKPSFKFVKIKE